MSRPTNCLVFDGTKVAAALRVRFPMMNEAALQDMITVASEVCDLLQHAREARIAQRGASWRSNDAFAEAIAYLFNMESMSQADSETANLLEVIDGAIHAVYCKAHDHTELPAAPPAPAGVPGAPNNGGRGGFRN